MDKTPRTDAFWDDRGDGLFKNVVVIRAVEFCRQLERELSAMTKAKEEAERERDEAKDAYIGLKGCTDALLKDADRRLAAVVTAYQDARSALQYIRRSYGELYGVGWKRMDATDAALARAKE